MAGYQWVHRPYVYDGFSPGLLKVWVGFSPYLWTSCPFMSIVSMVKYIIMYQGIMKGRGVPLGHGIGTT